MSTHWTLDVYSWTLTTNHALPFYSDHDYFASHEVVHPLTKERLVLAVFLYLKTDDVNLHCSHHHGVVLHDPSNHMPGQYSASFQLSPPRNERRITQSDCFNAASPAYCISREHFSNLRVRAPTLAILAGFLKNPLAAIKLILLS